MLIITPPVSPERLAIKWGDVKGHKEGAEWEGSWASVSPGEGQPLEGMEDGAVGERAGQFFSHTGPAE